MHNYAPQVRVHLKSLERDRVVWGLFLGAFFLLFIIPVVSIFSMRQVQGLAITLSLSGTSLFLLVSTVFFGSTAIWRDFEKKYLVAVLSLPLNRYQYVLSKYISLTIFLVFCLFVFGLLSSFSIMFSAAYYPAERSINWLFYFMALIMLAVKYLLLLAWCLVFSSLSTSFILPVFGSLGIYLAGSASHQVVDFLVHNPEMFSPLFVRIVSFLHYLIPNFAAFDYQVYAIYGLPISWSEVAMSLLYGTAYIIVALTLAAALFNRREI